ncbi:MAG: AAA family ATPase [Anaerolineales bacterium]|nr:AAA family ATPase [Anaerolineales bacterium]
MPDLTPVQRDLAALLRAWPPLVLMPSLDYPRAKADIHVALAALAATTGETRAADVYLYRATPTAGIVIEAHPDASRVGTVEVPILEPNPIVMLDAIRRVRDQHVDDALKSERRCVIGVVLEDAHVPLSREHYTGAAFWAVKLRELAAHIKTFRQPPAGASPAEAERLRRFTPRLFLFALGAEVRVPDSLTAVAATFRYPLPTPSEIEVLVRAAADQAMRLGLEDTWQGHYGSLVDALRGLPSGAVAGLLNQAVVRASAFGPELLTGVLEEKQRLFEKLVGGIATFTPPGPRRTMAGYEQYKAFVERTRRTLMTEAPSASRTGACKAAPLVAAWPFPLGALLIGPPGTGKTQMAYYTAAEWQVPLISVSLGALQVGGIASGQANLRVLIQALDAIGPCILLLDELLKQVDTTENAKRGGGTSEHLKVLSDLMTWMEIRNRGCFILGTGNTGDLASGLPEGLLERFPYVFRVDLPDGEQRAQIWSLLLERVGVSKSQRDALDLQDLAARTDGLVGRDLRAVVDEALGQAFDVGEPLAQTHCLAAVARFAQRESIGNLRVLAAGRARTSGVGVVQADHAIA